MHHLSPKNILILDPFGNLKGVFTYAESTYYTIMTRNLLLGYDSTTSTYIALIQSNFAYGNGFKLFGFTFSSSNPAPSF